MPVIIDRNTHCFVLARGALAALMSLDDPSNLDIHDNHFMTLGAFLHHLCDTVHPDRLERMKALLRLVADNITGIRVDKEGNPIQTASEMLSPGTADGAISEDGVLTLSPSFYGNPLKVHSALTSAAERIIEDQLPFTLTVPPIVTIDGWETSEKKEVAEWAMALVAQVNTSGIKVPEFPSILRPA